MTLITNIQKSNNIEVTMTSITNIQKSNDLGGHGGTLTAEVGKTHCFLKPMDVTEYKNYKTLQSSNQKITQYMPQFFGETIVNGKSYMILENLLWNGTDTFKPLADIKLSGKVDGIHPIASQDEMRITRGHEKGLLDREWMRLSAQNSPNYMIVQGKGLERFNNYKKSDEILSNICKNITPKNKKKLIEDLHTIKMFIIFGDVAFIGSSILLVQNPTDESVRPVLIDPAHVQYGRKIIGSTATENTSKLFSETMAPEKYKKRIKSNFISINAIIKTIKNS